MTDKPKGLTFFPLRKKKHHMDEQEAWAVLHAPELLFGTLATHGLPEENPYPYAVPMNFCADTARRAVYLHTTLDADSKRNRSVAHDDRVCFSAVAPDAAIKGDPDGVACNYSMTFSSVIVFGRIVMVDSNDEKAHALNLLMEQKSGNANFLRVQPPVAAIAMIYRINVEHITGARKE